MVLAHQIHILVYPIFLGLTQPVMILALED